MPWDGKKLPDTLTVGATAAANAAANGSKNAAYLTYLQGQIGANFKRQLYRDDTKVWEATASGSLPISGSTFALPSATQNSISTADIDTGTWVHYVRNASDDTKYIATQVTTSGGAGPARLSADLAGGGTVTLGSFVLRSPSLDTAVAGEAVEKMISDMGSHRDIWNPFPYLRPSGTQAYSGSTVVGCDLRYNAKPDWWKGPQFPEYPYWNYLLPWSEFWAMPGHTATNTCVASGDFELWALYDNATQWVRVTYRRDGPGDIFEVAWGGGNGVFYDLGTDSAGYRLVRATGSGGQLYHGYGTMGEVNGPTLRAMQARFRCRKQLIDPNGPDDRASAIYAVHGGCDVYAHPSIRDYRPANVLPSALSKCFYVTNDWQWIYVTSLSQPPSDTDKEYPYNSRQFILEADFRALPTPAP